MPLNLCALVPLNEKMEKLYQIALTNVEGVGSVMFRQLISNCGSAENVFKVRTDKLLKIPGIGRTVVEGLKKKDSMRHAFFFRKRRRVGDYSHGPADSGAVAA